MTDTTPKDWEAVHAREKSTSHSTVIEADGSPDIGDKTIRPTEPYMLMGPTASRGVRPLAIREAVDEVEHLTSTGWLTVVMGPETIDASAIPNQTITQDTGLERRLVALQGSEAGGLLAFYDALMRARVAGREVVPDAPGDSVAPLSELRLTLLRAAYRATRLYVLQWASGFGSAESGVEATPTPVHDWESHMVVIPRGADKALRDDLRDAVERLEQFEHLDDADQVKQLLGHQSIILRLNAIRSGLKDRTLRGPVVEWLTDLAWHALIFDSPCYPSPSELAFQVSVAASTTDHPFHRLEPTAMADRQDANKFRRIMKLAMRRALPAGEAPAGEPGAIQAAVASALYDQHQRWDEALDHNHRHPFPIAISLTTDIELERALARHAGSTRGPRSFFVAFPIVIVRPNNETAGELRWIAGEFRAQAFETGAALWHGLTNPIDDWHELGTYYVPEQLHVNLAGPLVLKVNGSPLHHVATDLSEHPHLSNELQLSRNPGAQLLHAPAITELDVLQLAQVDQWALGAKESSDRRAGLPSPIYSEFEDERRTWLLMGHDLMDWSSRLQLFIQISRSALARGQNPRALAIGRRPDPDRARLLQAFRIPYAGGAFEQCVAKVTHAYAPKESREGTR